MDYIASLLSILAVLALAGIGAGLFKKKVFGSVKLFLIVGALALVVSVVFDFVGLSAMLGGTGIVVLYVALKFLKIGPFRSYG